MSDRKIWNYLEELTEQEAAWKEWQSGLMGWHRFNIFYTHYLTAPAVLTDTISSLYLSQQKPFILMVPTVKNITTEIQQFMAKNNSILLSMTDELHLQPDGSFKPVRSMTPSNHRCLQTRNNTTMPIEACRYLAYNAK